ncbi:MAG: dihydroorotate dehydrogenase [Clostridia bacterium]
MIDTKVVLFGHTLDNPIIPASGTFGFGYEFSEYYDINILGSIALKATTLEPRFGNPLPRIAECPAGMINAIGLQNPGVDAVINKELPRLSRSYSKAVIANIGGSTTEDYIKTAEKFNSADSVFAVELNISCPNVKEGGMAFGTNEKTAYNLIKAVKSVSKKPILVKLSPNVTDIVSMALAAQDAGADGISLINTLVGMRIDLKTAKPIISVKTGGYSGPGVFPVALRMVYQVAKAVTLPIIGMGGVMSAQDVIEMMYAGASAVMVGTANLIDPFASKRIIEKLPAAMQELKINKLSNIIGRSLNE